jgi:hypothetical protein
MDMGGVSTVGEALSATYVPLHLFGQLRWIENDDPVPFRPYGPGVAELSQRANHDLAHRTDRRRQVLLGDPNDEFAARIAVVLVGRGEVEKLARNALTHRSESGPWDLVDEGAGALAQLDQERACNPQISLRQSADLRWRDHQQLRIHERLLRRGFGELVREERHSAQELARAAIPDGHRPAVGRRHEDPNDASDDQLKVLVLFERPVRDRASGNLRSHGALEQLVEHLRRQVAEVRGLHRISDIRVHDAV